MDSTGRTGTAEHSKRRERNRTMDNNERIDQVIAEAAADGQDAMGQLAAVWAAGLIEVNGQAGYRDG